MNKIKIFFILFLLVFAIFPKVVDASNTDYVVISVMDKSVHRGMAFELDVKLDDNPGITSILLTVKYDTKAMTLTNVERKTALSNLAFTTSNKDTELGYGYIDQKTGGFNLLWDGISTDNSTGTLITLTFDSFLEAETGEYDVEIVASYAYAGYQNNQSVKVKNGLVTLTTGAFEIEWRDWDGEVLKWQDYNDISDIEITHPTNYHREDDSKYSYLFNGFKKVLSEKENQILYIANYLLIPQKYNVFFYVDGINDAPDGKINLQTDYYKAIKISYDSLIKNNLPSKDNYTFYGWYLDEAFTKSASDYQMPDNDINLYGYFKYNIREKDYPVVTLTNELSKKEGDLYAVDIHISNNTGINGMLLTLKYDAGIKVEKIVKGDILLDFGFSNSNLDSEEIKLLWDSTINSDENGLLATVYFSVANLNINANYYIDLIYEEGKDITYIQDGEIWYSLLDLKGTNISVGKKNSWTETHDNLTIHVTTSKEVPFDTFIILTETKYYPIDLQQTKKEVIKAYEVTYESSVILDDVVFTLKFDYSEEEDLYLCYYVDDELLIQKIEEEITVSLDTSISQNVYLLIEASNNIVNILIVIIIILTVFVGLSVLYIIYLRRDY